MEKISLLKFFDVLPSKIIYQFLSKNTISKSSVLNKDFIDSRQESNKQKHGLFHFFTFMIAYLSRIVSWLLTTILKATTMSNFSIFSWKGEFEKLLNFPVPISIRIKGENRLFIPFRILVVVSFIFISSKSFAQIAAVNPPTGGFNIDGRVVVNSAAGDWAEGTGGGGFVFNTDRTVNGALNAKLLSDAFDSTSDLIFSGSSFSDNPNMWKWSAGKATSKCDINNVMLLATTSANSKWVILGGDRFTTTGTSYIDFEFLQGILTRVPNGDFTSFGPDGTTSLLATNGRTPGDFVLSMEYSNGGTNATVHYYVWEKPAGSSTYKYVEHTVPAAAFAKTNGTATNVPFGAFGLTSYIPYAFVEAAVNIDAIITASCKTVNIKTIFVKTKASDSYNAALKDFVEPQPVNFTFGQAGLNYGGTSFCKTGILTPTAPAIPNGAFTYTPNNGGLSLNGASGVINLETSTPGTYIVTYTPSGGVCLEPATATITVNAIPTVVDPADQTLCNGASTTAVNFTGAVNGTDFNWTNNNTSIGLAASGSGNIASFAAVNSGTSPVTATITVTPSANGCTGASQTFTITVNPTSTVADPANQTLCNGASIAAVNFTGTVSGTAFNWTNNNNSIGLAASGSGNIASFAAVNSGTSPVTATITVAPSANGCTGASQTFTITVNPTPTVTDPADQTLCNGASIAAVNFTGAVSGTAFNWTNNNTSIGLAASGSGNIASFAAVNLGTSPVTATITVTPSANGCTGASQTFTITVNPTSTVADPANQTLCNGASIAAVNFTGTVSGTVFNWTNNNTSIGLAASGSGNIVSFAAVNSGTSPVTATITVTPSANGCTGASQTFTITVNPTPTVADPANQTLCNGASIAVVNFTGTVSGTAFNWTNNNTSIGLAANGSGNIASFAAVNSGSSPVTATITVTPSANGCTGASQTFTITVNPTPAAPAATVTQTTCSVATGTIVVTAPLGAGITYSINGTDYQSGTTFNNVNPGDYNVTAKANGCVSNITVKTVNNRPDTPDAPSLKITEPSLCGPSTGSIEVCNPVVGYTYKLNGANPGILAAGLPVIFSGLTAGSNPSVTATNAAGCTSDAANCGDAVSECGAAKTTNTVSKTPEKPAETVRTDKPENVGFEAYPVPFKDQLNIRYKFDYSSDVKIEVYNAQGILVLSKVDSDSYFNKEFTLNLNLNDRTSQMYIVKVSTNRGSNFKKVISSR